VVARWQKHRICKQPRCPDPDKSENADIFTVEAKANGAVKQLTTWGGHDNHPKWSPDGKYIAYLRQNTDSYNMYDHEHIVCDERRRHKYYAGQRPARPPCRCPEWSKDGKSIRFLVEDDMERYVAATTYSQKKLKL
jgi:Tol biopolymer transport system component